MKRLRTIALLLAGLTLLAGFRRPVRKRNGSAAAPSSTLNMDFTGGVAPPELVYTRSGTDAICLQTSESAVSCTSAANTALFENRGTDDDAGTAMWVFPGFSNLTGTGADENYTCGVWWTCSASAPTITNNAGTAPNGTNTAGKIEDTDNANVQSIKVSFGGGAIYTTSVWTKTSSPLPTGQGFTSVISNIATSVPSGSSTLWHRVSYTASGDGVLTMGPAAAGGTTASDTGAALFWGESKSPNRYDLPLLRAPTRTTGQATATLTAGGLSHVFEGGDADLELEFISSVDAPESMSDTYPIHCTDADGEFSVRIVASTATLRVRGVDVVTSPATPVGYKGIPLRLRFWYKPSTGKAGIRAYYNNGTYLDSTAAASGSPLTAPTACFLGSFDSSSFSIFGRIAKFKNFVNDPEDPIQPEVLLSGDSLTAGTAGSPWGQWLYTPSEGRTRPGIAWIAHPGDTIADQTTKYNASPWKGMASIKAIAILIGINDIHVGGVCHTDVQVETDLQTYVNLLHTNNPNAKIYVLKLLPAKSYLLTQTCGAHSGAQMYAYWQGVNAWLHAGNLTNAEVIENVSDDLNDGADSVKAPLLSGDLLHLTSEGYKQVGLDMRMNLKSAGFLVDNVAFARNFTNLWGTSDLTYSRTGGDIILPRSDSTAVRIAAGSTALFQNYGNGQVGTWSIEALTNLVPANTDFQAGWTPTQLTNAASPTTDPVGTTTAGRITDNVNALSVMRPTGAPYATGNTKAVASVWLADVSGNAPTVQGKFTGATFPANSATPYLTTTVLPAWSPNFVLPTGTTWKRRASWYNVSSATAFFDIVPAGEQDATYSTNQAATGALDIWAPSYVVTNADVPTVLGSSSAVSPQLSSGDAAALVQNGKLNVVVSAVSQYFDNTSHASGYFWSGTSTDGVLGVRYTTGTDLWEFIVRGVTVLSVAGGWNTLNDGTGYAFGVETSVHVGYDTVANKSFMRIFVGNSLVAEVTGTTTGGPLATPTAAWLGSLSNSSGYLDLLFTGIKSFSSFVWRPEGLMVGDSIVAWSNATGFAGSIRDMPPWGAFLYSATQVRQRAGIASVAHAGDTSANQKTAFDSWAPTHDLTGLKWVIIQIGINDVIQGGTELSISTSINALTADIRSTIPNAIIIINRMLPAGAVLSGGQKTIWAAVNLDIDGTGAHPITNVDWRVSSNSTAVDDGAGNIQAPLSQDGVHLNAPGKVAGAAGDVIALGTLNLYRN